MICDAEIIAEQSQIIVAISLQSPIVGCQTPDDKTPGVVTEKGRGRTATNAERISKAVDAYYALIKEGVKPHNATTEACRAIEAKYGLGDYKNFETFRNMVNRVIARRR